MPLTNYSDLTDLDAAQIRRLLDPNTLDRSEVNRVAAERALGGGGFSGARQNRLLESEINQRALQGHQMLAPYLQMQQQSKMQTQSEAATMARQLEADKQAFERLRFSNDANDQQQARDIAERIRSQTQALQAQQMENDKGRLQQTATQERGIQAELNRLKYITDLERSQPKPFNNPLSRQSGVSTFGSANPQPTALTRNGGVQPSGGPNSATLSAINQITSSFGGGGTNSAPSLLSGGNLGSTKWGSSYGGVAPGWGGNGTAKNTNLGGFGAGAGVNVNGGFSPAPMNTIGPLLPEQQPVWQSGSNPDEINWGAADAQIQNPQNWSYNSYEGDYYA